MDFFLHLRVILCAPDPILDGYGSLKNAGRNIRTVLAENISRTLLAGIGSIVSVRG
jgi:hypothetical protein